MSDHTPASAKHYFQTKLSAETDCWDVHELLQQGETPFTLVDARSPAAYREGHVPGAVRPDRARLDEFVGGYPSEREFVVYCTGPQCNGADKVAAELASLGRRVRTMLGGMWGWRENGFAECAGDDPGSQASAVPQARMTVERLGEFGRAWSAGDIDVLMTFIADDCVYSASVGPDPGMVFRGKAEVRRGFEIMIAHDREAESRDGECFVSGNRGVAKWSFVYQIEGRPVEISGCDLLEFDGDKIRLKDAYRKVFQKP